MTSIFSRSIYRLTSGLRPPSRSPIQARAFSEEDFTRYCPGGYHPVRIGDVFSNGKYRVLRKLGYGVYSTVWLARVQRYPTITSISFKLLVS